MNAQPQNLFGNAVSVVVDGTTGDIVADTSVVGITNADIARTGTGVYTLDVGMTKKMGSVTLTPFSDTTLPTFTNWVGSVVTVTTRNYAGAAADGTFQLTAQRNSTSPT